ncbi:MAG: MBL fold metallo-hydrolase [Candidatus Shapirobacteria bacterium]
MEIKYLGWQSFRISEKKQIVLTQPYSLAQTKMLFPKSKADLVFQNRKTKADLAKRIEGVTRKKPFWPKGPGEYEVAGVDIRGYHSGYWFRINNFRLAFWWSLKSDETKDLVQDFPNVNILFLKVDQSSGNFARRVKEISQKISPEIIIPFCSENIPLVELKNGIWAKPFLDALDQEDVKAQEKLVIGQEEIGSEESRIVLLEPKI